jgi:HPt (histidine-containing phosphotransfer) domain-containing protein
VPRGELLDIDATLGRLGGDRDLYFEMIDIVLQDLPKMSRELHQAVRRQDSDAIASRAHALKGLIAGCGGIRAAAVAQVIETAGHKGEATRTAALLPELDQALQELTAALIEYRG